MFSNLRYSLSIRKLENDDPVVQIKAVKRLEKLGDIRAVKPLILLLNNAKNIYLRKCTIQALGSLHDVKAVETLIKQLEDNHEEIVETTAEALGELNDRRAIEPLKLTMMGFEDAVRSKKKYVKIGGVYTDEDGGLMLGRDVIRQKEELQKRLKLVRTLEQAIRRIEQR